MAPPRTRRLASVGFWLLAVATVPVLLLAWFWFGQMSGQPSVEQCELLQAGGAALATPLLVLAHVVVLMAVLLVALRAMRTRARAVLASAAAVAVASVVGILVNQWFWRSELFGPAAGVCGF
jgi:hypothetical protein